MGLRGASGGAGDILCLDLGASYTHVHLVKLIKLHTFLSV